MGASLQVARVSFTLRKEDVNKGSYLRYDEAAIGARPDYDSALKSEGLQIAPIAFSQSFFDATSVCYGEVSLSWGVNIVVPGATPDVSGVVMIYSPNGEPQTISSGQILVESSNSYAYEHVGVPEGHWAYYSLFVHYTSTGGDDYYEKAASLSVLQPKNYGSTLMLWNRIPEFYRNQDQDIAQQQLNAGTYIPSPCAAPGMIPFDAPIGPLFKYLSIIGYDMDRMRTILDYVMTAKDPILADGQVLDAVAQQMGVTMKTSDLGAARLRNVMDDIGYFRRSKGTPASIEGYAEAVGISEVDLNQTAHTVKRYAQRVNYVTVPKTATGIYQHRPAHVSEVATPTPFAGSPYATPPRYTITGTSFQSNGTGASAGVTHALIRINSPVPVEVGDAVGFSIHSGIGTEAIKWVRLVDAAGVQQAISYDMKRADGAPAFLVDFFGP